LTHFIEGQLNDPDNPDIDFNIGTAYYRLGKFDEATQSFERAARSEAPSLKNKALYNLGNSRFKKGEVEKAIDTWENLLETTPDDKKITENLAFAKKTLEEMKKQQKDQEGQGDKKGNKDGDSQASDEKNPGQQGQKDQDRQDGKDSQGKDQQTPSGEEDPGKDQAGQQPPPPSPEEGDQQSEGAGGKDGEEDQAQGMQGKAGEQAPGDEEMQQAASALNRLKDKPGGVMMRRAEKRRVEKDW